MTNKVTEEVKEEIKYQTIAEFLESTPPNQLIHISDLSQWHNTGYGLYNNVMRTPEIQLHCDHENCNGIRFFRCVSGKETHLESKNSEYFYVTYLCSNCQRVKKAFSLAAKVVVTLSPKANVISLANYQLMGHRFHPN